MKESITSVRTPVPTLKELGRLDPLTSVGAQLDIGLAAFSERVAKKVLKRDDKLWRRFSLEYLMETDEEEQNGGGNVINQSLALDVLFSVYTSLEKAGVTQQLRGAQAAAALAEKTLHLVDVQLQSLRGNPAVNQAAENAVRKTSSAGSVQPRRDAAMESRRQGSEPAYRSYAQRRRETPFASQPVYVQLARSASVQRAYVQAEPISRLQALQRAEERTLTLRAALLREETAARRERIERTRLTDEVQTQILRQIEKRDLRLSLTQALRQEVTLHAAEALERSERTQKNRIQNLVTAALAESRERPVRAAAAFPKGSRAQTFARILAAQGLKEEIVLQLAGSRLDARATAAEEVEHMGEANRRYGAQGLRLQRAIQDIRRMGMERLEVQRNSPFARLLPEGKESIAPSEGGASRVSAAQAALRRQIEERRAFPMEELAHAVPNEQENTETITQVAQQAPAARSSVQRTQVQSIQRFLSRLESRIERSRDYGERPVAAAMPQQTGERVAFDAERFAQTAKAQSRGTIEVEEHSQRDGRTVGRSAEKSAGTVQRQTQFVSQAQASALQRERQIEKETFTERILSEATAQEPRIRIERSAYHHSMATLNLPAQVIGSAQRGEISVLRRLGMSPENPISPTVLGNGVRDGGRSAVSANTPGQERLREEIRRIERFGQTMLVHAETPENQQEQTQSAGTVVRERESTRVEQAILRERSVERLANLLGSAMDAARPNTTGTSSTESSLRERRENPTIVQRPSSPSQRMEASAVAGRTADAPIRQTITQRETKTQSVLQRSVDVSKFSALSRTVQSHTTTRMLERWLERAADSAQKPALPGFPAAARAVRTWNLQNRRGQRAKASTAAGLPIFSPVYGGEDTAQRSSNAIQSERRQAGGQAALRRQMEQARRFSLETLTFAERETATNAQAPSVTVIREAQNAQTASHSSISTRFWDRVERVLERAIVLPGMPTSGNESTAAARPLERTLMAARAANRMLRPNGASATADRVALPVQGAQANRTERSAERLLSSVERMERIQAAAQAAPGQTRLLRDVEYRRRVGPLNLEYGPGTAAEIETAAQMPETLLVQQRTQAAERAQSRPISLTERVIERVGERLLRSQTLVNTLERERQFIPGASAAARQNQTSSQGYRPFSLEYDKAQAGDGAENIQPAPSTTIQRQFAVRQLRINANTLERSLFSRIIRERESNRILQERLTERLLSSPGAMQSGAGRGAMAIEQRVRRLENPTSHQTATAAPAAQNALQVLALAAKTNRLQSSILTTPAETVMFVPPAYMNNYGASSARVGNLDWSEQPVASSPRGAAAPGMAEAVRLGSQAASRWGSSQRSNPAMRYRPPDMVMKEQQSAQQQGMQTAPRVKNINQEIRASKQVAPQPLPKELSAGELNRLVDRVYDKLEKRIRTEYRRRGL